MLWVKSHKEQNVSETRKNIMGMIKNAPNEYAIKRGKNMRIYQSQYVKMHQEHIWNFNEQKLKNKVKEINAKISK